MKPTTPNPEPVKASSSESEKQLENPNTFVPPSEVSTSKEQLEVEKEDLDKLFEDSNQEKENQTVQQAETATTEQKLRAGETLLEIQMTDMFEQVVASKPDAKRIVSELMAESLAEFYRRKDTTNLEETTMKAPEDFDIRNFAS